jgi:type VI secretion system protein ImpH
MVQISVRDRNPALREFFDLFNNRFAGLLYDSWAKYRVAIEKSRSHLLKTPRPIDMALRCLVGLGTTSLSGRNKTPDATFVFFGGLLSRQGRSATAIEHIMSGMLGHTVRVEQFHGAWLAIDPVDRTRLPGPEFPDGVYCKLGEDSVVGERIFDVQSMVVLEVTPMKYSSFRALLPDGTQARAFSDLAAIAVGSDKAFRVRLSLLPSEVPPLWLMADPHEPGASRLGWNTWLNASRPREAPEKVEFRPPSHLR